MGFWGISSINELRFRLHTSISGPHILAFLPAVTLAAFWIGGEQALLITALGLPAAFALAGSFQFNGAGPGPDRDQVTGLALRGELIRALAQVLKEFPGGGRTTACLVLRLDDFHLICDRFGQAAVDRVLRVSAQRIRAVLRDLDTVVWLGNESFGVALAPVRRADLEALIQLSGRLQSVLAEPISLDATTVYTSASVGFCLASRAPSRTGLSLIAAAEAAMAQAQQQGPGSIRAYSSEVRQQTEMQATILDEVGAALENGEITPWFQPQISTDTGQITGFEALARWVHPEKGLIAAKEFLPVIEAAGLSERLSEVILFNGLTALKKWDEAKLNIPTVGVNFSTEELLNPKLVDKIKWELDRFEMPAKRLTVEILETVVAGPGDDVITRNLAALAKLGCGIDLDDFGTGNASIANIRRFAVGRIKIDRSFVVKVDEDQEQQRMVSAILTMAEQLQLDTLAEGVESIGEHAMLAQLGCRHVQGYSLAKPMPFDKTLDWIAAHNKKLLHLPQFGHEAS